MSGIYVIKVMAQLTARYGQLWFGLTGFYWWEPVHVWSAMAKLSPFVFPLFPELLFSDTNNQTLFCFISKLISDIMLESYNVILPQLEGYGFALHLLSAVRT